MTSTATMNSADGLIAVLGNIGKIIGEAAGGFLPFQVLSTTSAV